VTDYVFVSGARGSHRKPAPLPAFENLNKACGAMIHTLC
jgi:hypothetical protein